jgi:uncharacterized protein
MIQRELEYKLLEDLSTYKIVNLQGAKQSGKSTLIKKIATEQGFKYFSFDNPQDIEYAKSLPTNFVAQANETTVILNEIQKLPEILPFIKIQVDKNNRNGQFILVGSADLMKMKKATESLAGIRIDNELMTLSVAEINNSTTNIIDLLVSGQIYNLSTKSDVNNDKFYEYALKGGYPEVQNLTTKQRKNWFKKHILSIIAKNLEDISVGGLQKKSSITKMLKYFALQSGSLLNYSTVAKKLNIDVKTVKTYFEYFDTLFLSKSLMPYFKNINKRQLKTPKIYFSDSGLLSYFLNIEELPNRIFTNKIVENFIFNELSKNNVTAENPVEFYFYKDKSKYKVDFILENNFDELITVEVKTKETLSQQDYTGIRKLKRLIGNSLSKAYIFYAGKQLYTIETEENINIIAVPFQILLK